ncbi:SpoIID/LytB domain-containing protein [Candidatus Dojkabacteria bacterium]|uniref:SpoIID/LytB domain-containing protein n=1 Tax=Candidatus Dojkabacteria bacterium TaxID=2099670 RepID=A0A955HYM5_9BACT|nr:SpoIID/LytB domain-containing protein [Candidatus Dojkabacteria bacterium]MCB9791057.1 SpoIID/LytB domain-containing protein [Candidatus Nomurabacteria bacterium]
MGLRHSIKSKKVFLLFTVIVAVTAIFFAGPVFSDDVSDLENDISKTKEQIDSKKDILADTQAKIDKISKSNLSIDQKIAAIDVEISSVDSEIQGVKNDIKKREEEISNEEKNLNKELETLKIISASIYKDSRMSWLEIILVNQSNPDFWHAVSLKRYVLSNQRKEILKISDKIDLINDSKDLLEEEKGILAKNKSKLEESRAVFVNERAQILQQLYVQAAKQQALRDEIGSLNKQLKGLTSKLQKAIAAKAAPSPAEVTETGGGNTQGGTSPQTPSQTEGEYQIFVDGEQIGDNYAGPIRLIPTDSGNNVFRVNGTLYYRGALEFRTDSNVYMINELPFETYLFGLGEVPSSWPSEALKAQAIAGRTYAAQNWSKRSDQSYNLRDDTFDQNYVGYSKEAENGGGNWVAAVNSTKNKVLKSGGQLISAYYHSTCGGHTLASEEVWVSALSYARAESDWYQSGGNWVSYDASSPWSYKKWGSANINDSQMNDLINATIYLSQNPNSQTRQNEILRSDFGGLTPQQLLDKLGDEDSVQVQVGDLTSVKSIYNNGSTQIDSTARMTDNIHITGVNGTMDLDADSFWIVFNARSPGDLTLYYSNFWTSVKESGSWNFYSRGYPHRVGMCQYGAYGRASAGQNYSQILTHYYEGTSISTFNPPSVFRVGITRVATGDTTITSDVSNFSVYSNGERVVDIDPDQTFRLVKQ